MLSRLQSPGPLAACWPLLAADGAASHPRWLQLGVRVLEAAAHAGPAERRDAKWREAAEQLLQVWRGRTGHGSAGAPALAGSVLPPLLRRNRC